MSLCFIINSFNNKTIDAMGAAILPPSPLLPSHPPFNGGPGV